MDKKMTLQEYIKYNKCLRKGFIKTTKQTDIDTMIKKLVSNKKS